MKKDIASTSYDVDYLRFFDSLPNSYIAFLPNDPEFTIVAENEAHARVALSKPGDAIGKHIFDAFPDNSEKYKTTGESDLLNSLRRVISTGKPDLMPLLHYDVRDKDGTFVEKWWRVTHYPVFNADGKLVLLYQYTEDVTQERQTSQQLQLAQGQLDSALAIGLVSTWSWDMTTDTVIGDANLARSFGVKPELAATGLPLKVFTDSIHEEDRERVIAAIQLSVKNDVEFEQEYRTKTADNTIEWVIARGKVQKGMDDKPVYLLGVIVDITERKKAELELEEIKSMFNALFESSIICVAIADINGTVTQANQTFLRTFGYTKKDLEHGLHSKSITPARSTGTTKKIYDELRTIGEAKPTEKEYIRKDGTVIPMLVGAVMLPKFKDRFIAFMLDISENKELKEINKTKDEFIGMASHQLRTPATSVKQYVSLLRTGFAGSLNDEQQSFVEKAYSANERQLRIVNDLLKTAQLDSDRYIFKKAYIEVDRIVNHAISELKDVLDTKQQTISYEDTSASACMYVDSTEMNLVLVNLIENASKYSSSGDTIQVLSQRNSKTITISVTDHGVGIATEDQDRIFGKFTRVNNELSNTVNGTGLGLYWVQRIIHLHGGSIKVTSTIGKGSTFSISLPYEH